MPTDGLTPELNRRPEAGFFGRDETLLALDRAFDTQRIVLLHAYAGSGKTSTAVEFARWYHVTGGVEKPPLFTSFEHKKTLLEALNESIGTVFADDLLRSGIQWLTLPDDKRREAALQLLEQIPVLWVWDNVERIGGFPTGTTSTWNSLEQQALANFLRAAQGTKAKILLTSRRYEREWIGDLPARIRMPPMPMQERSLLARALADKRRSGNVQSVAWAPLLHFSAGNPMTLTVLVNQVVAERLYSEKEIVAFLDRVRTGMPDLDPEDTDARDKSLTASLNYGFEHAFNNDERQTLALLHLFHGCIDPDVLCQMGEINCEWCLKEIRGLTNDYAVKLLDRCADAGMLMHLTNGCYSIHPALPWFLKTLFDHYYPSMMDSRPDADTPRRSATVAFVRSVAWFGELTARHYEAGSRDSISFFVREEQNLLNAFSLAREHRLFVSSLQILHALRTFYKDTGRGTSWEPLLTPIVADVVNTADDGPRAGLEEEWSAVTEFRILLAGSSDEALRLSRIRVRFHERNSATYHDLPVDQLDEVQRYSLRNFGGAVEQMGNIFLMRGDSECLIHYSRSLVLYEKARDRQAQAVICFKIAQYFGLPSVLQFDQQQSWLFRSHNSDRIGRARCLERLGSLSFQDFLTATKTNATVEEGLIPLQASIDLFAQALSLLPEDAILERAGANHGLGRSLRELTRLLPDEPSLLRAALEHYHEAIRGFELLNDAFHAGGCRLEMAPMLAMGGRLDDAREYASAALRDFEKSEGKLGEFANSARSLLNQINSLLR
jgi:hypothetical protein